jgi:hypothetical protein
VRRNRFGGPSASGPSPNLASDDPRTRARALNFIGYVGDARVLPHLERRLEEEGLLDANENHTLFAIGEAAAPLLDRSARRTAERMDSCRQVRRNRQTFTTASCCFTATSATWRPAPPIA